MRALMGPALIFAFLGACSSDETQFGGAKKAVGSGRIETPVVQPPSDNSPQVPASGIPVKETLRVNGQRPLELADFLFIVDNSSSMTQEKESVRNALLAIPAERFPQDSRLGVMTTMAAQYSNFALPHAGISTYTGIETEPGFLDLVTASAILKYKQNALVNATYRAGYAKPGCASGWFGVREKDAAGNLCFDAAMQSPLHGVGCEAGLNAFEQMLLKYKAAGKKVFRGGAFAHVILVSDETYPGCSNAELLQKIPTYGRLKELVYADSAVLGFKIHGIGNDPVKAPIVAGDETQRGKYASSARRRADDSAGVYLSMGSADYSTVIEQMVVSGKTEKAIVTVASRIGKVEKVLVDGKETKAYRIVGEKNVELTEVLATEQRTVEVIYLPAV
jgi:hypothetical protein